MSQVRHALTFITTWYLFLKENITMRYCMLKQMMLPIMKTRKSSDSEHLAMKTGDIQSQLRKLQMDMIENGNINSDHLNSRGLHLNGRGILQFAKSLIESIQELWFEKELLRQKKVSLESCDSNSRISSNNFTHNYSFFQPNINSINSFNANFKNQRESVANQISNKAKNTNYNLDIEELINLRKLFSNNIIIGYLNINSLRNEITKLREVCRKA